MATTSIAFDASRGVLPVAPHGTRLQTVSFATCPGSDLRLECAQHPSANAVADEFGVVQDSWWRIVAARLPERTLRLTRGAQSLRALLRRYGFMDASGCVNHRDATASYVPSGALFPQAPLSVVGPLRDTTGVPQFYWNSGNCWFGALCTVSFGNTGMRNLVGAYMDGPMRQLAERALFHRDSAEALRKRLWYECQMGDDVEDSPVKDGRNGFTEFTILCAKLKVPLARYRNDGNALNLMPPTVTDRKGRQCRVPVPCRGAPHLLAVRFQDGDHKRFPVLRCLEVCGVQYDLVGWYAGQRKCGHQIGISLTGPGWRDAVIGDSDLHKDGISPVHVRYDGAPEGWWPAWQALVHVTKFGAGTSEFCNLSPHNPPDDSLDRYRRAASGSCSLDMVYIPRP